MMSHPNVSVILSVYNGAKYVEQSIDSILNQTYQDFELIIVDDGSTDETPAIINRYQDSRVLHLCHLKNHGLVASLNEGLSMASAPLIARQDADDISLPTRLEQQVRLFQEEPELVVVGARCEVIDEKGEFLGFMPYPCSDTEIRWNFLFHCGFAHTSVMFRADVLHRHGLRYDERMLHAEDYDLWSKLLAFGKGKNIEQPLVRYRRHSHQISAVYSDHQEAIASGIARTRLRQLGVSLSLSDVSKLRFWFLEPRFSTKQQVQSCQRLLEILDWFGKQNGVNSIHAPLLRQKWVDRIFYAMTPKELFSFKVWKLIGMLVLNYRDSVVDHWKRRLRGKYSKVFGYQE